MTSWRSILALSLILALTAACSSEPSYYELAPGPESGSGLSFSRDIEPILNRKCIACHACYDAPCQLKLTGPEGVDRGATKLAVYDGARTENMAPTRLLVDAMDTVGWREKGFYSVTGETEVDDTVTASLMGRMLELGRSNGLEPHQKIPEHIELGLARQDVCPTPAEFDSYAEERPQQGMPLAVTGLTDQEYVTVQAWLAAGADMDEAHDPPTAAELQAIAQWEGFLNNPGPRGRLVGRYLFEHLYLGHLYFSDLDTGHYFELIRSRTPSGEPVQPVATVRPNDDPGGPFHYRLRKINSTIVHKTHIVYALNPQKLARLRELFLGTPWTVTSDPGYGPEQSANPFATFADIPARSRYVFMLENAEFFVRNFIRGPVCRGQIATNVIDDHFHALFQDPDHDLYITEADYREQVTPHLKLPGQESSVLRLGPQWLESVGWRNEYVEARRAEYARQQPSGFGMDTIWDGEGSIPDAMLTVFRHHDNASVVTGFVGETPETIWLMDYPLLERTYYQLVVNFDVFGNVGHQAETRLYFDLIRAEAEVNFLALMPAGKRNEMRAFWYRGAAAALKEHLIYGDLDDDTPSRISYRSNDPMTEFVGLLQGHLRAVAGPPDVLNRCLGEDCGAASDGTVEGGLRSLTNVEAQEAPYILFLPDVTFVGFRGVDDGRAITLVRNRAHRNVAFMVNEEDRLEPERDTVTVFPGLLGSYPNFIFSVPEGSDQDFLRRLRAITDQQQFEALVQHYGVRRSHPLFWEHFHWFHGYMTRTRPLEAGIYDLNRYRNL